MIKLRVYQDAAVEEIRGAFARRQRRVLLVSPTGSGKTVMFSWIGAAVAEKGKRVTILVHRQELVDQTSAALAGMGVTHGIIAAGYPATEAAVQVASVATLARRLDAGMAPPDLIVADEAHHAVAGSWRKILDAAPEAFVLGVTATPERLDGRGLGEAFDVMVMGPSVAELTAAGFLVPARVYAPRERPDLSGVRVRLGDYEAKGLARVMADPALIEAAVRRYQRSAEGCPAVAFCASLDHSEAVAAAFRAAGIPAAHVDGSTDRDERRRILAALGTGELRVVTNAALISEGFDLPAIGAAILLRPTQSGALHLQQVGRALRPAPGKARALIFDLAGNTHAHGLPDAARTWSLDGRGRRTRFDPVPGDRLRHCANCEALAPAGTLRCEACGRSLFPTPAEREDERRAVATERQREAQERQAMADRLRTMPYPELLGWATSRERLEFVARVRGYKRGWVDHQMRDRQAGA